MSICIDPKLIDKVQKIVTQPSSISRDKQLADLLGNKATAKEVNRLYEESLLLSNQKTSLEKFIDNINGVSVAKKAKLKEQIAERLANRTQSIQEKELLSLAQDIWNGKYDIDIPLETIKKINNLKVEADQLKAQMAGTVDGSPERLAYGNKIVEIADIVNTIKNPRENLGVGGTIKGILKETGDRFKKENGIVGNIGEGFKLAKDVLTSAVYKSVQASMDLSYSLRQGFKVLTKDPKVWASNMAEAFKPFLKLGSKKEQQAVADMFKANLVSRDLYQQAMDSGLAIGVIEDFFPTTIAEKIPVVGNALKASNEAFTIFSQGSRMGLFENMYNNAVQSGTKMTPQLAKDLAYVANSITGRGSLGKFEAASSTVNKILFSGRYIKSSLDTFTMPFKSSLDPIARKEAMKSSVSALSTMAALMGTASLFTDVEWNPQSSKFGKMKVPGSKDTWIDLTAGIGSYLTLATRIATGKTKSAITGQKTDLYNPKYGGRNAFDVLVDFSTNKLAPAPAAASAFLKGRTYSGEKPTIGNTAAELATPISLGNTYDVFTDETAATALISSVFDILGASQTNYNKFK